MTTCFRLTRVRSVTIRMEQTEEAVGFLPRHLVDQEQAGVDISAYSTRNMAGAHIVWQSILVEAITNQLPHLESLIIDLYGPYADSGPWTRSRVVSDYLTSKIGGLHLRNICARTLDQYHFWSCLDDTAVDFVKTTTNGAIVEDVFIGSLPGSHLSPAVFDNFSPTPNLTFNTTMRLSSLEGLELEKCGELGLLSKEEAEEKEIKAADAIITKMSSGRCNLSEVAMAKVVR